MNQLIGKGAIFLCLTFFFPLFGGPKIDFLKASLHGNLPLIQKLLSQEGIHLVDLRDKNRNTPLHLVCYAKKNKETAKTIDFLIKNGADVLNEKGLLQKSV